MSEDKKYKPENFKAGAFKKMPEGTIAELKPGGIDRSQTKLSLDALDPRTIEECLEKVTAQILADPQPIAVFVPGILTDNEELTQADIDSGDAQKCECCKKWDLRELMKNHPAGYYCESCWDAMFG